MTGGVAQRVRGLIREVCTANYVDIITGSLSPDCQYALKIDPLCASKIDPPTAKYTVLFLTSFYIEGLHI